MTSELKTFPKESRAKEPNADLKEVMDVEDVRKEAMEAILGNLVKVATEKEVTKIKNMLRKNSSAGAESHAPANNANGPMQSERSAGKQGRKPKPVSLLRDQQRGHNTKKEKEKEKKKENDRRLPQRDRNRDRSRSNSPIRFASPPPRNAKKDPRNNGSRNNNRDRHNNSNDNRGRNYHLDRNAQRQGNSCRNNNPCQNDNNRSHSTERGRSNNRRN